MSDVKSLDALCQEIMNLDPLMRSARIINNRGHLVAGGMKSGLRSLEDAKHDEMMFMELALRVRMRHEFDPELGPVHFSMSYREKVIIISYPLRNGQVLLTSGELGVDFKTIPFKVLDMIRDLRDTKSKTF